VTEEKNDQVSQEPQNDNSTPEPEASTTTATLTDAQPQTAKPTPAGKKSVLMPIAIVILTGVIAIGGYFAWTQNRQQQKQLASVNQSLQQQRAHLSDLQQALGQAKTQSRDSQAADQELLQAIQQRLDSHNKRLLSLSTTSREDWLLAEAEYLLRLANQRLLMERGTRGAQALVQAADDILHKLDDVELFPVRKALAKDLNALKLAGHVDREGLYLRLAVLAEQVETLLPLAPQSEQSVSVETSEVPVTGEGFWSTLTQGIGNALQKLGAYVRIRQHREPVQPLLSPEHAVYLSQNLRLMIERAQLAMLREESKIYVHSLDQARRWLGEYYALNEQTPVLQQELKTLRDLPVAQPLPNISGSLAQLKAYIERLHKLAPKPAATATTGAPTVQQQPAGKEG